MPTKPQSAVIAGLSGALPRRLSVTVAVFCLLAAVTAWLGDRFGTELTGERLPAAPWWVVLAGGVAGAAWAVLTGRRFSHAGRRLQLVAGSIAALAMLSGSVLLVPHNLLFAIVWLFQRVNPGVSAWGALPGPQVFPPLAAHLVAVLAAGLVGYALLWSWRRGRGVCVSCGRGEPVPPRVSRRWLVGFGVLAILGCLPYAFLKLAWSLGWQIGMTGAMFDEVGFASPGFGDTVVPTAVSVLVSAGMLARLRARMVRMALLTVGTVGSLMLLPIAPVGVVLWLLDLLGVTATDESEIAAWVFHLVYLGFLAWGVGLAGLTVTYYRATKPACARHVGATAGEASPATAPE